MLPIGKMMVAFARVQVRYSDGWDYGRQPDGSLTASRLGYPAWWLRQVGYSNGPQACLSTCP